jgi:hypothetical protein
MKHSAFRSSVVAACLATLALASGTAFGQGHGGGGHVGGVAGGHGGYGYGGHGYYGGYRGGYYGGYRGGYYGWRGGYYGGWGWGWGLGLGLGLYVATLPYYYSTLWWDGIPNYYANNTYYVYDGNVGQYQTVAPPPGLEGQGTATPAAVGTDLMAYPKAGQSSEQQAKDKYECHHWATEQSGFDPTQGATATATAAKRSDYMRAQAACLEGRGYSVK